MGSESCESSKSDSNSSKSNSEKSNSGEKDGELETMDCKIKNSNTTIKRVWLAKKSIELTDRHIIIDPLQFFSLQTRRYVIQDILDIPEILKPRKNIFNINNNWNSKFKHWAIILELSNDSYINIQFGRHGFSLKKFNQTNIDGENILNAIINIWGEKDGPVSFCYLGQAEYS